MAWNTQIQGGFNRAAQPESPGGDLLTKGELQGIVKKAKKGKFTDNEKATIAHRYAGLFNGQDYAATTAATQEYKRIADKYGFPVFWVR